MENKLQFYRCMIDPGYIVFSEEPTLLFAVCGRGVVITLWDRISRSGGMVHCILPNRAFNEKPSNYYINDAIPMLLKQFLHCKNNTYNLEAQIVGGGYIRGASRKLAVKTVQAARRMLKRFNIEVVSEDVGGSLGKKVVFNTFAGDAVIIKTKAIRKTDWVPEYVLNTGPSRHNIR